MVYGYYRSLVDYLEGIDPGVQDSLRLLEPPVGEETELSEIEEVVTDRGLVSFHGIPPRTTRRFVNAMDILSVRESGKFSKELTDYAVYLAKKEVVDHFENFGREVVAKRVLNERHVLPF